VPLLVDVEGHGREPIDRDADVSNTVGWFTSIFPILLEPVDADESRGALAAIQDQLRQTPLSGIGYGLLRYATYDATIRRSLEALPQAGISFNYLGRLDAALSGSTLFALVEDYAGSTRDPRGGRSHLIEIDAMIVDGRLEVSWVYNKRIHDAATIRM